MIVREDKTSYFMEDMYVEDQNFDDPAEHGRVKIDNGCFDCFYNASDYTFAQCSNCDVWVCVEHRDLRGKCPACTLSKIYIQDSGSGMSDGEVMRSLKDTFDNNTNK